MSSRLKNRGLSFWYSMLSIIIMLCTILAPTVHVSAMSQATLGNLSPWPANSVPDPPSHVHYIRNQGQYAGIQPTVDLEAYYPADTTPGEWNNDYIQLLPGSPISGGNSGGVNHVCDEYKDNKTDTSRFLLVTLTVAGAKPIEYDISYAKACAERDYNSSSDLNTKGTSSSNVFFGSYPLPRNLEPPADASTGLHEVEINISYGSTVPANNANGIRFIVKAPVGNPDIGELGDMNNSRNFSLIADWTLASTPNKSTKLSIPFGQDCTAGQTDTPGAKVRIYDADNGLGFDDTVTLMVKNDDTGNYVSFSGIGSNNTDNKGNGSLSNGGTVYTPPNGSGTEAATSWAVLPHFVIGTHYQLEIHGLDPRNTIALGLPGDAIFGVIRCGATVTAHAQVDANGRTYSDSSGSWPQVPAGQSVTFRNWVTTSKVVGMGNKKFQYSVTEGSSSTSQPTLRVGATGYTYDPAGLKPTGQNSYTFKIPPGTALGTQFCRETIIDASTLEDDVTDNNRTAQVCVTVGTPTLSHEPYFSVLGGDIAAGPAFMTNGTCDTSSSSAGIDANFNTTTTPYGGASSQLAALALDDINGFASDRYQSPGWTDSLSPPPGNTESSLIFANTAGVSGQLNDSNWCVDDYYSAAAAKGGTTLSNPVSVTSLGAPNTDTYYTYSGFSPLHLNGGTIQADGRHVTITVNNQDVYISGNGGIKYGNAGSTLANLPSFSLRVNNGRILVDPNIGELDGFYDAQGTNGAFITCADSNGAVPLASSANTCNTQLTVYGAVAATNVVPNRTYGDANNLSGTPQQPAETFQFTPQLWLPNSNGGGKIGPWDSVTSLPPIL